jgi:hypothetical protein
MPCHLDSHHVPDSEVDQTEHTAHVAGGAQLDHVLHLDERFGGDPADESHAAGLLLGLLPLALQDAFFLHLHSLGSQLEEALRRSVVLVGVKLSSDLAVRIEDIQVAVEPAAVVVAVRRCRRLAFGTLMTRLLR